MTFKYLDLYLLFLKHGWHLEWVMEMPCWCKGDRYEFLCIDEWYSKYIVVTRGR
jgi:hypothetical protein